MQRGLQYISLVISFSWILLLQFHELGLSQKSSDILASLPLTYKLSENSDIMIPHPQDILNATLSMYNDHIFNGGVQLSSLIMQPDEGVIFIKTHKTASTTMNSIFWRSLCIDSQVNCFLSHASGTKGKTWNLTDDHEWSYLQHNSIGTLPNRTFPYDAWIYHVRYDPRLYEIIPKAKRIFTIIRRPAARFQSAWHWYELHKKSIDVLPTFIEEVTRYNKEHNLLHSVYEQGSFTYRQGLDVNSDELLTVDKDHLDMPRQYSQLLIDIINGKFVLLITERFDECLILLKKIMNWNYYHILYVKQFVQKYHSKASKVISNKDMQLLDDLQPYDQSMYTLANLLLDKYIKSYGPSFQDDLQKFQKGLLLFHDQCTNEVISYQWCKYFSQENAYYIEEVKGRLDNGMHSYLNISHLDYLFS